MGGLTKGLANIIPILLSTAGSRCNITDTKQRDLLTNISTNQILTNRVCVGVCAPARVRMPLCVFCAYVYMYVCMYVRVRVRLFVRV